MWWASFMAECQCWGHYFTHKISGTKCGYWHAKYFSCWWQTVRHPVKLCVRARTGAVQQLVDWMDYPPRQSCAKPIVSPLCCVFAGIFIYFFIVLNSSNINRLLSLLLLLWLSLLLPQFEIDIYCQLVAGRFGLNCVYLRTINRQPPPIEVGNSLAPNLPFCRLDGLFDWMALTSLDQRRSI